MCVRAFVRGGAELLLCQGGRERGRGGWLQRGIISAYYVRASWGVAPARLSDGRKPLSVKALAGNQDCTWLVTSSWTSYSLPVAGVLSIEKEEESAYPSCIPFCCWV